MDAFSKLHPAVILLYYSLAFFLVIFYGHPLVTGLAGSLVFINYVSFAGIRKGIRRFLGSMGVLAACLTINPLLNHRGVTLLFMLGDSRITWESFLYGGNMAMILLSSLYLFASFSHYMKSEKIMTLFGRHFPAFSLLFSMILRFVPKVGKDYRAMTQLHGSKPPVWSALIGLSLEDSLARSLSMKGRGYGSGARSSYYGKSFAFRDVAVLVLSLVIGVLGIGIYLYGEIEVRFFPTMKLDNIPFGECIMLVLFYSVPLIMRGQEEMSWLLSRQKITDFFIRNRQSQR